MGKSWLSFCTNEQVVYAKNGPHKYKEWRTRKSHSDTRVLAHSFLNGWKKLARVGSANKRSNLFAEIFCNIWWVWTQRTKLTCPDLDSCKFHNFSLQVCFSSIFGPYRRIIQQINVKNVQCRDFNPWPLEHESSAATTRPGIPHNVFFLFFVYFCSFQTKY